MKNTIVVVIGGDHYNTYGIIRSLGEKGIKSDVLILGQKQKGSFVLKSKYVRKGYGCKNHEQAIGYLTNKYDNTTNNIVICCSDEAEELIIKYFDKLSDIFILPICKDFQETQRLMNKMAIGILAKSCGIKIPKSWEVIRRIIPKDIEFPCLTKPAESTKGHKSDIVVCHSRDELIAVINAPQRCSDFVVQEYINFEKEVSILGVVLENGDVCLSGCIDKLRTCAIGTTSFGVMVDNELLGNNVAKLEKMMKQTGYRGLFSAEFLKKEDTYYFLEVNFRNDGNTYVATASGINLPYLYLQSFFDDKETVDFTPRFPCYFMFEIEDFKTRHRNNVSYQQWKQNLKQVDCCLVYNKDDKAPFRKKMIKTVLRPIRIVLRKLGLIQSI